MNKKVKSCLLKIFTSEDGKVVLDYLKEFSHWYDCGLATTEALNAYVLGRRSVVCEIENVIDGKEEDDE